MVMIGDENLLTTATASSGAFVAVITTERRILSAAGTVTLSMGDAILDRPCFEIFYGLKAPCNNCGLDQVVAGGGPIMTPRSETQATGGRTVYNHIFPLQSEAAADAWVCADLRAEIPTVKKSDLSIAFLSKLIQSAVDGVIAADKNGRIRIYNKAAAALFGYSIKEALAGMDVRRLYPENVAYYIMRQLRDHRFGGKNKLEAYRVFVLNKSGETIPIRLNASIICEGDREMATIGFFRDLREEYRLKKELADRRQSPDNPEGQASLAEIREGFTLQMAAYDSKFSAVAVANGLVTDEQVNHALMKQQEIIEKTKIHIPIGRVLIQMGAITETQRDALLSIQNEISAPVADVAQTSDTDNEVTALADASAIPEPAITPVSGISGDADAPASDVAPVAFDIRVTDDGLTAVLEASLEARGALTAESVLDRLAEKGIAPLETAPADIAAFLKTEESPEASLVVARGTAPVCGSPPEIQFHFETDPLKTGTERDDGTIDWKNRGGIPQVMAGDALATVTPGIPGTVGKDVFGNDIPDPKPLGAMPTCGKGTGLSEDGLTFSAVRNGMAQISANGVLDVLETLTIDGDIGLDTGHVDFDGHIEVAGSVQEGYRVSGGSMRVTGITGADVTLTGDLVVTGGIYDATVKCAGSLRASHIHKSRIYNGKDLTAGREIIDSQVETNGKCVISGGIILSSEISAKMGIITANVGTDAAKPSTLSVGVDLKLQRQIKNTRNKIRLLQKENGRLTIAWEALSEQAERTGTELGEKAQQQDKCMVQIRELTAELEALPPIGEKARRKMVGQQLQMAEKKKQNLDAQVEDLLEKDDSLSRELSQMVADWNGLGPEMALLKEELEMLLTTARSDKGVPTIKASGKIAAGTTIAGPNATVITKEELSRVLVMETDKPDEEGVRKWRMSTQPLR